MSFKRMLQSMTPPLLWSIGQDVKRRLFRSVDHYAYAPGGWRTTLPQVVAPDAYWSAHVDHSRAECEALIAHVRAGKPVMTGPGADVRRIALGYVLALVARDNRPLRVLDYGGGLGEDYWVSHALMPGVPLDYHCKELPSLVEAGRALSPDVKWHTGDDCLDDRYDLVMFSSSLHYLPDWKQIIDRAAAAAGTHLFISNIPVVRRTATCVATERSSSVTNLHWLLNRDEVAQTVDAAGFTLVQEIAMGDYPKVANAPEQPDCVSLLFERRLSPPA